ncbi:GntR family transcriptional regulator [Virgibacillus dakarensis]|uniref:GntR family transcriptional regulator n=1 Tax=Lentibacillus populi TaxID=1827502 RepID=A0A9W5X4T6_9BACI|nr:MULTISPECIES: GntR family transcriptional regulator [Bacillaceae]MBT2217289.1 GntR family transcriptional regulator [Virgibacillus dakarensis]MTW86776.1 GntR family transcriptional regulator [Virgibacillus dakarensis]GGB38274.1 GntR family transcriptional regulator [Lentibacillus populi]
MELPIRLSKDSREPIYHQIENQLKALIAGGHLVAGTPLPSIRALSNDLEISIITTRRAYQDLEQQGFIRTTQGKGTFVAEIADEKRQQVKISSVYQTIENAVDTAIQYDYSLDQIKEIFLEIIDTYRKKGE